MPLDDIVVGLQSSDCVTPAASSVDQRPANNFVWVGHDPSTAFKYDLTETLQVNMSRWAETTSCGFGRSSCLLAG